MMGEPGDRETRRPLSYPTVLAAGRPNVNLSLSGGSMGHKEIETLSIGYSLIKIGLV